MERLYLTLVHRFINRWVSHWVEGSRHKDIIREQVQCLAASKYIEMFLWVLLTSKVYAIYTWK